MTHRVATPAGMVECPPGMAYDRASHTWITAEEMARREAEREERRFMRRLNQGAFPTPHIMRDFRHYEPTRMTDGTVVTSRAEKRAYQERTGLVDYDPIQHDKDRWTADHKYRAELAEDIKAAMEMDPLERMPKEKAWEEAGFSHISEIEALTEAAAPPEAPASESFVTPPNLAAQPESALA